MTYRLKPINETDLAILERLTGDARITHAEIAEKVGLSRPAVTERVRKLEHAGIIKGYSAVLAPEAMGKHLTAFITARASQVIDAKIEKALQELSRHSDILELHTIAGEDCFIFKIRTTDIASLNAIIQKFKNPPLQMTTKTAIVLESHFEKLGGTMLKGVD